MKKIIFLIVCFASSFIALGQGGIAGQIKVCGGEMQTYNVTNPQAFTIPLPADFVSFNGFEYAWSIDGGTSTGNYGSFNQSNVSLNITWENTCGAGKANVKIKMHYKDKKGNKHTKIYTGSLSVTIYDIASSVTIGGAGEVECKDKSTLIYTASDACAMDYTWSVPVGWQIVSGQGSRQLKVKPDENFGGTISVNANNVCSNAPQSVSSGKLIERKCPFNRKFETPTNVLPSHVAVQNEILIDPDSPWINVPTNSNVKFKAGSKIVIKPGFKAFAGSSFNAKIGSCTSCLAFRKKGQDDKPSIPEDESLAEEFEVVETAKICPNPTEDVFTIRFNSQKWRGMNKTIKVFSTEGRLVLERESNELEMEKIDISEEQRGAYLVVITTPEGGYFYTRVIKK